MNIETLEAAIEDGERFLGHARQLLQELREDADKEWMLRTGGGPVIRGQVRRYSMDLTRSLADMRRPG